MLISKCVRGNTLGLPLPGEGGETNPLTINYKNYNFKMFRGYIKYSDPLQEEGSEERGDETLNHKQHFLLLKCAM
jgi:hypothetical protein